MSLMKENDYRPYTGAALKEYNKEHRLAAYFPGDDLKEAVELARLLQRPLLLRGEPGCGKTRLAEAIAFELYGADYKKHYFPWYIKSTTKARDGLYIFDHLQRLRDVNAKAESVDLKDYRKFGPLGEAFSNSTPAKPAIVLIDEIDKADLDFPNDLLLELDERRFFILETEEEISTAYPPIIIITSNDEKELPGAFLRRCVFHYIEFPDDQRLIDIVKARLAFELKAELPQEALKKLIARFQGIHKEMGQSPNADLPPSTSALLDWTTAIAHYVEQGKLSFTKEGDLKTEKDEPPYLGLLFKSFDDYRSFGKKI